jgi:hypothetical protein
MDREELYDLIRRLIKDPEVYGHFLLYDVAREVLGD